MRALVYCRVSTDAQERDGTSLDTQERACAEYAARYEVVRCIRDSVSGYTLDRPGLAELRALMPEADVIVAYAVDRLSRNQNHIGVLFDEAQRHGVRLEFVTERFEDTAVGRFIISARAFIAEVEREKIAERTMRGKRHHAERGRYIGKVPYGYVKNGDGLVIDEGQAAVVRRIFALYLDQNLGLRRIAIMLNAERVPTRGGGPWYANTIAWMLSNEAYTGVMRWRDIRHEDHIPVIISRDRWQEVRRRRTRKAAIGGGQAQTGRHLLTGVLFCGVCKGRMSGKFSRSRDRGKLRTYRGYQCSRSVHGAGCVTNWHDAEDLEARVLADLAGYVPLIRIDAERRARMEDDLSEVEKALRHNATRRRNVIDAIADGRLAEDDIHVIDEERAGLDAQRARLTDALTEVARRASAESERPDQIRMLVDPALPLAERKAILQRYVSRIEAYPGEPEPLILE